MRDRPITEMDGYDVVVVGAGAAGLCATLEAASTGVSVLLVEAEPIVGGTSRLSGGIVMGCASRLQKSVGVDDSSDLFYREYLSLEHWAVEPAIVRRLAEESGPGIDWLEAQGMSFRADLLMAGEHCVPRAHVPIDGAGQGAVDVLYGRVKQERLVDVALGQRVDRLVMDGETVVGIAAGADEIRAGAVVLASGGFGAAPDLVERYMPSLDQGWGWYIGSRGSRGDAFSLLRTVDAEFVGFDCGHIDLRPNFYRDTEAHYPGWLVFVDRNGRRICDETMSCGAIETVIRGADRPIFAIFDHAAVAEANRGNAQESKKNAIDIEQQSFDWVGETIEAMVDVGRVRVARTIDDLASQIGVPVGNLGATIQQYNVFVEDHRDGAYMKDPIFMKSVDLPPFYSTELRLSMLAMTAMGPKIDSDSRVIGRNGRPVLSLYAAGECAGGVLGPSYFGHGASWMNCVVFGRVAGRNAATKALDITEVRA